MSINFTKKKSKHELGPVILEQTINPTLKNILATDLCFKSGLGTPMYSRRGQSTIPEKLVFREKPKGI